MTKFMNGWGTVLLCDQQFDAKLTVPKDAVWSRPIYQGVTNVRWKTVEFHPCGQ